jgi:uncharacterized membrane protein
MHWSAYETFSVISGLVLAGMGLVPETSAKDRFWTLVGGAGLVAYALYVANQDSGTYYFPGVIFVLPFAMALWVGLKAMERRQQVARRAVPPAPPAGEVTSE